MRMVLLAVIAAVVFEVFVLVFAASADKTQVRAMPKWAWILICIITPVIGGVAYLVFGRPIAGARPQQWQRSSPAPKPSNNVRNLLRDFFGISDEYEPGPNLAPEFKYRDEPRPRKRPVAPDDDPEFLRELDALLKQQSSGETQVEGDEPGADETDPDASQKDSGDQDSGDTN